MSPLSLILAVLFSVGFFWALSRLSSRTSREITIPFEGTELPMAEITAALERMGCLVSEQDGHAITALTPGDMVSFGQVLTIRAESGRLRVRSRFSDGQAWRGSKNQENLDRFKIEWDRRREFQATAANRTVRAASEAEARGVARKALWRGQVAVAFGVGILLLAFFLPRREGESGSRFYLAGLALWALLYGLVRMRAAVARLRKKADG